MGALHRGPKRSVARVYSERLLAEEVHSEFDQSVAHREKLLIVHRIVLLRGFQLSRLVTHDAFAALIVELHERAPDGKVARVTHDMEGLDVSGSIKTGADARLFFTASDAS